MSGTSIRISLNRSVLRGWPITIRVQRPDLAVVAEGVPGLPIQVPANGTFFASAVDASGLQVAGAVRLEPAGQVTMPDLTLPVFPSAEAVPKVLLEGVAADAASAAGNEPGLPAPPFRHAYVLRRNANAALDAIDADLAIQYLDPNKVEKAPEASDIAAFGLVFMGPSGNRLAVLPIAFDDLFERAVPTIVWRPGKTPGFSLPSFTFQDPATATACAALGRAGVAVPTDDSRPSAFGSVLRALGSLRDLRQWDRIEEQSRDWRDKLHWIADAQVVRAEVLARLGRHSEAREVLASMPPYALPWTRQALICLSERSNYYGGELGSWEPKTSTGQWYRALLGKCHPVSTFCVFELSAVGRSRPKLPDR